MLKAFGRAVTRAVDFFIEANVDHARQQRKLNSTLKGYSQFRKDFYHASAMDILRKTDLNKWVSVDEVMVFADKAAGSPVFATPYDKQQHLSRFTNELRRKIHSKPDIAYKSTELSTIDGFYLRAVDIWNTILDANLPDGGKDNRVASYHDAETKNGEVPRNLMIEGGEQQEWLNLKYPMIYGLMMADDCTHLLPELEPYNIGEHGQLKTRSNSPYIPFDP